MSHKPCLLEIPSTLANAGGILSLAPHIATLLHRTRGVPFTFRFVERSNMSLRKSPRYSLRSRHLSMIPDVVGSHKTCGRSPPLVLGCSQQSTMPSLIDLAAHPVSEFYNVNKTYLEDDCPSNPKTMSEWQDFDSPTMIFQNPSQHRATQVTSNTRLDSTFNASTNDYSMDQNFWSLNSIHVSSEMAFPPSSSNSIIPSDNIDVKFLTQPDTQTQPSPTYVDEPHRPNFYHTLHAHHRGRRGEFTSTTSEKPSSQTQERALYQEYSVNAQLSIPIARAEAPASVNSKALVKYHDGGPLLDTNNEESDADGDTNAEPYAQLIYRALKSKPGFGMILKEIYDWFEKNTDKAKNPMSKGWQNSIRHNLSMNGVFKLKFRLLFPTC